MSDETLPMEGPLPDDTGKIDEICLRYAASLQEAGPPADVDSFLGEVAPENRGILVERLVGIELGESTPESETPRSTEDFFVRYPGYASAVKRALNRVGMATVTVSSRQQIDAPSEGIIDEVSPETKYAAGEEVARGGMGAIRLAEDMALRREVAMKTVLDLKGVTHRNLARFVEEAQITGQLEHPGIVPVYEMGVDPDKRIFYTMKFVKGRDLQSVLSGIREGDADLIEEFPLHRLMEVYNRVCDAVAFAHSRGVIHRDLKPANIMLGEFGEVLVMDWGLAKIMGDDRPDEIDADAETAAERRVESIRSADQSGHFHTMDGAVMGTPHYMSPEQAEGRTLELDHRTDLYSLGAILYAILTLRPPVEGSSISELLEKISTGEVISPSQRTEGLRPEQLREAAPHCPGNRIPEALGAVAMRALSKDPAQRYGSVPLLQKDLDAYQRGFATSAEEASLWRLANLFFRRHKAAVGVLAVIAVLLAVSSVVNYRARKRADLERDRAEQLSAWLEAERSETLFAQGKDDDALAYLARQLRRDPSDELSANRLFSALTWRDYPLPLHEPLTHQSRFKNVLFSPDGKTLYTSSSAKYDSRVVAWDVASGEMLHSMRHDQWIVDMTISDDGRLIASASGDNTARVWDATRGEALTPPLKFDAQQFVRCVALSPNGRLVAAAQGRNLKVWRIPSGEPVETGIPTPTNFIFGLEFSPDGKQLALGLLDSKIRVYSVGDWQAVYPEMKLRHGVHSLAYSPDGTILASGDATAVRLWNAKTGQPIGEPMLMGGGVPNLEFDATGTRIVAASGGGQARVWDVATASPIADPLLHLAGVTRARFSPNGERVLTASVDHTARIWDATTGEALSSPLRQQSSVIDAIFDPSGSLVATVSNDRSANIWDVRPGSARSDSLVLNGDVLAANLLPDGKTLLFLKYKSAHIIDLDTMSEMRAPIPNDRPFKSADLHRNGRWLATIDSAGILVVRDLDSGERLLEESRKNTGQCVSFSPDGSTLLVTWGGAAYLQRSPVLKCWDTRTWQPRFEREIGLGFGRSFSWSPDGTRVHYASASAQWRLFDAITGEPLANRLLRRFRAGGLKVAGKPLDTAFSGEGEHIVTGTDVGTVRIWNGDHGEPETAPMQHQGPVHSVAWSQDNRRVLTGSEDGTAQIWDAETAEPAVEPMQHNDAVTHSIFHPNGRLIATATVSGTVRLWDATVGQAVSIAFESGGSELAWLGFGGESGEQLVGVTKDGRVRKWQLPAVPVPVPQWLPDLAEALGARRINEKGIREDVSVAELAELREKLHATDGKDFWSLWARWFFADRDQRPAFPEF